MVICASGSLLIGGLVPDKTIAALVGLPLGMVAMLLSIKAHND